MLEFENLSNLEFDDTDKDEVNDFNQDENEDSNELNQDSDLDINDLNQNANDFNQDENDFDITNESEMENDIIDAHVQNLKNQIPNYNQPLYENSNITYFDSVLMILRYSLRHSPSKVLLLQIFQ